MESEIKSIHFMDADINEGKLLFYNSILKGFIEYYFDSGTVRCIEIENKKELHITQPRKVLRDGNNLFFIESSCCVIHMLSQLDNRLRYEKRIYAGEFNGGVKNAFIFNGEIWVIPMKISSPFVIFNIENMVFRYHRLKMVSHQERNIRDVCMSNGGLYIVIENSEKIIWYDMKADIVEIYETGISKGIEGIAIRYDTVLLREKGGKSIYSLGRKRGKCKQIAVSDRNFEILGKLRVLFDGTIIICPIDEKQFFYVDEKNCDIKDIRLDESIETRDNATFTIETGLYKERLYVYPWASDYLISIYKEKDELRISKVILKLNQKVYSDYAFNNRHNNMIEEQQFFTLADYLEKI